MSSFIDELLNSTYQECVDILIKKYGKVLGDFFLDKECLNANKSIKRGREGIFLHHIDEDKAILLSESEHAVKQPFSYQKSNRLVYCNLLEHLILHIKIVEKTISTKYEGCGAGGIYAYLVPKLNEIYCGKIFKEPWRQKVAEVVLPLRDDYLKCIKKLVDLGFNKEHKLMTFSFLEKISHSSAQKLFDEFKKQGVTK